MSWGKKEMKLAPTLSWWETKVKYGRRGSEVEGFRTGKQKSVGGQTASS